MLRVDPPCFVTASICKHPHDLCFPDFKSYDVAIDDPPQLHWHSQALRLWPVDLWTLFREITMSLLNRCPVRSIDAGTIFPKEDVMPKCNIISHRR